MMKNFLRGTAIGGILGTVVIAGFQAGLLVGIWASICAVMWIYFNATD